MCRPLYICIDGMDGCGKTTIVNHLIDYLGFKKERSVVKFKAMGQGPIGRKVRERMMETASLGEATNYAEALYAAAGQVEALDDYIIPALEAGSDVVSDRFTASYYAYQVWANQNSAAADIFENLKQYFALRRNPDIYIYLSISPELSKARIEERGVENSFDLKSDSYRKELYEGYKGFYNNHKGPKIIIDASLPLEIVKSVVEEAIEKVIAKTKDEK